MRGWNNALLTLLVAAAAATGAATAVAQQAGTQFIGITSYRVGPYGANGAAFFSGFIDYLALVNERDGGVNGVKLSWEECETEYNTTKGVECYERLKTKTATGPDRNPSDVHRHHLLPAGQGADGQDPAHHARLRTHRRGGRARVPLGVPARVELLGLRHGDREVHHREGRRRGQRQGQEDRSAVSRLRLRQGTAPGAGSRVRQAGLRAEADPGAASRQRAAVAVAADPPVSARLGHPLGLGRDERDRAQDRPEGRLPARQDGRATGGPARRPTPSPPRARPPATTPPA